MKKTGMERSSHIQQGLQTGESWSPLSRFMGWGVLWIWIASNVLLQYPLAEKKVTYLCVVRLLLDSTTALEGLFGEYHSSSAALGKRRLGVTKQPPFGDWGGSSNTRTSLMFKTSLRSNAEERSVAGV